MSAIAYDGRPNKLVLFDSHRSGTPDPDLEVDFGNLAIIPENVRDANHNGLVDSPNDSSRGGKQIYRFDNPVTIVSFVFVDKDNGAPGTAKAFDSDGDVIRTVSITNGGESSIQTFFLNANNVSKLQIDYHDSGAVTDIVIGCPGNATPTPSPSPSPTPSPTPVECDGDSEDDDNDDDGHHDDDDDDDNNDGEHDDDDDDDDGDGRHDWEDGDDDDGGGDDDNDKDHWKDDDDDDDDNDGIYDWEDEDDDNDHHDDDDDGDDDSGCEDDDHDDDGEDDDYDDDDDNDGFKDVDEQRRIGTGSLARCGPHGWPADLYPDGDSANTLDILDILSFVAPDRRLETNPGDAFYDPRWDLSDVNTFGWAISIEDLTALLGGTTGAPPMFGGQVAFGRTCVP
jgi:hypothetical protein